MKIIGRGRGRERDPHISVRYYFCYPRVYCYLDISCTLHNLRSSVMSFAAARAKWIMSTMTGIMTNRRLKILKLRPDRGLFIHVASL